MATCVGVTNGDECIGGRPGPSAAFSIAFHRKMNDALMAMEPLNTVTVFTPTSPQILKTV